jgi:hypothetical protein
MKRFSIFGVVLLVAGACMAQSAQFTPSAPVQLTNMSILSTNWSSTTADMRASGNIDALFIGITNSLSTATNSVTVFVQVYDSMDIWRMVYSNTALTASTVAYPSVNRQDVYGVGTNTAMRIPVYGSQMKVSAYNAGLSTNCNVKVWALISQ